jgi:hypothetical protein
MRGYNPCIPAEGVIAMDGSIVAALIVAPLSFAGALITVVLTQSGSRKRDHEADWRKLKLESYTEYFTALSEANAHPADVAARVRYIDAANRLTLVAPPVVLAAFNPYQKESNSYRLIQSPTPEQIDLLNSRARAFIRAMREDCHPPGSPKDADGFEFQLYLLPPGLAVGGGQTAELQKTVP